MAKKYLDLDVYSAAKNRINYIFNEFENIVVSFSGGKDSGVMLNLCIDEARERNRRFGVLFIDVEAYYEVSEKFLERMIFNNLDVVDPYWVCLPMESPNALSYLEPYWIWWEEGKDDIWVRNMPKHNFVINLKNNPIDFYTKNMTFEEFVKHFANWYGKGGKTASLVGIRANESLNRFRAIVKEKDSYKGKNYSVRVKNNSYNFYPIYDWTTEDIWIYNAKLNKDYNKLYDLFYKAGISIHKMRVDEPFGNEAKAGLNMFKIIEPATWGKVVNRVSGANFGNIYTGNKIMTSRYKLPKNHTWKSFTKFLLSTLPEEAANNYKNKFIKFIRYWNKKGCPLKDDFIKSIQESNPDSIIDTGVLSNRGRKDKNVVKFKKIVDELPGIDNKDDVLTWKRMAMCIIKNDFICKSLSFQVTKKTSERQRELIEKYRGL